MRARAAVATLVLLTSACTGAGGGADLDRDLGPDAVGLASPAVPDPEPRGPVAMDDPDAAAVTASLFIRPEQPVTPDLLAAIAAVDGVADVAAPRRDDLALVSSAAPNGAAIDAFAPGHRVLVSAVVADDSLEGAPSPGTVLLTGAGAVLRDLPAGSTVVFEGHAGLVVAVTTAATTAATSVGSAEFVLHPLDADAVGMDAPERVFASLEAGAGSDRVAAEVQALLGREAFVRVRDVGDGRAFILSLSATKARFGEFSFADRSGVRDITQDSAWIDANIVTTTVPLLGSVTCHRLIIDDLVTALDAIVAAGLAAEIRPQDYAGCWAPRRTAAGGNLSKHAWGIALDINVDLALPGGGEVPHPGVICAFSAAGFRWGGDFPTPDNHHFEWIGQ